jgi:hypothetical protein
MKPLPGGMKSSTEIEGAVETAEGMDAAGNAADGAGGNALAALRSATELVRRRPDHGNRLASRMFRACESRSHPSSRIQPWFRAIPA